MKNVYVIERFSDCVCVCHGMFFYVKKKLKFRFIQQINFHKIMPNVILKIFLSAHTFSSYIYEKSIISASTERYPHSITILYSYTPKPNFRILFKKEKNLFFYQKFINIDSEKS
jgi:hypothetical protein